MRYTKYNADEAISVRKPFRTGGSLWAEKCGDDYVVYSYAAEIGRFTEGKWRIPTRGWSMTTGRHQTKVREGAHASGYPVEYYGDKANNKKWAHYTGLYPGTLFVAA
jgi:hypothetical protein